LMRPNPQAPHPAPPAASPVDAPQRAERNEYGLYRNKSPYNFQYKTGAKCRTLRLAQGRDRRPPDREPVARVSVPNRSSVQRGRCKRNPGSRSRNRQPRCRDAPLRAMAPVFAARDRAYGFTRHALGALAPCPQALYISPRFRGLGFPDAPFV
jgi:hypothetical protein